MKLDLCRTRRSDSARDILPDVCVKRSPPHAICYARHVHDALGCDCYVANPLELHAVDARVELACRCGRALEIVDGAVECGVKDVTTGNRSEECHGVTVCIDRKHRPRQAAIARGKELVCIRERIDVIARRYF